MTISLRLDTDLDDEPTAGQALTERARFALLLGGAVVLVGVATVTEPLGRLAAGGEPARAGDIALLALVPVGMAVLVALRVLGGVRMTGQFTPLLLALAVVVVGPVGIPALVAMALAAAVGHRLTGATRLLGPARQGLVVSLVAVAGAATLAVATRTGWSLAEQGGALPLAILVGLTDRVLVTAERTGPEDAARLLGSTLVATAVCAAVLSLPALRAVAQDRPDRLLVAFPVLLLLGRYTGLRLTELSRFAMVRRG